LVCSPPVKAIVLTIVVGDKESIDIIETESAKAVLLSSTTKAGLFTESFSILAWAKGLLEFTFLPNGFWLLCISIVSGFTYEFAMYSINTLRYVPQRTPISEPFLPMITMSCAGTVLVYFTTGLGGDYAASFFAKRNGLYREAEHQLINFVIPVFMQLTGAIIAVCIPELPQKNASMQRAVAILENFWLGMRVIKYTYAFEAYPASAG
jgi:hypothetical protein